jgi:hypothetical protein
VLRLRCTGNGDVRRSIGDAAVQVSSPTSLIPIRAIVVLPDISITRHVQILLPEQCADPAFDKGSNFVRQGHTRFLLTFQNDLR